MRRTMSIAALALIFFLPCSEVYLLRQKGGSPLQFLVGSQAGERRAGGPSAAERSTGKARSSSLKRKLTVGAAEAVARREYRHGRLMAATLGHRKCAILKRHVRTRQGLF